MGLEEIYVAQVAFGSVVIFQLPAHRPSSVTWLLYVIALACPLMQVFMHRSLRCSSHLAKSNRWNESRSHALQPADDFYPCRNWPSAFRNRLFPSAEITLHGHRMFAREQTVGSERRHPLHSRFQSRDRLRASHHHTPDCAPARPPSSRV